MASKIFTEIPMIAVGRWFDVYRYLDGTKKVGLQGEFEWGWNQIQNTFATLLAGLCSSDTTNFPNAINYIAVGEGLGAWDITPPTIPYSDTTLTTETFRKAITPATDIGYLDGSNNPSVSPTKKIEVTTTLLTSEANGDLREFGLFGGDATASTDSGSLVNIVTHTLIVKDSSFEIQRKIRIEFQTR